MTGILLIFLIALSIFFIIEIRRSLTRSKRTVELIDKYWNDKNSPKLIDEMFEYALNDRRLSKIVKKYNADKNDFAALYKKLLLWADFKKYNRFVPINSFFYASALEYLLSHKNDDAKSLAQKMLNYFHI